MAAVVTVNDVLDGHVVLDVECLDRIYLNGYVPNLQVGGQVAAFMTAHLGYPFPSPAIMEKIGTAFRTAVHRFAADNHIPVVRFGKNDRKIDRMRRYLARQAASGRAGVAAIGVAQEFAPVFTATKKQRGKAVWFSFTKADRRVTCYYFLPLGRRFRAGVCQGVRLFPVSDEGLGQRPRVGQAAGRQGRRRVHRTVQRVRLGFRSRCVAGDL
jgi:hypothetical protein